MYAQSVKHWSDWVDVSPQNLEHIFEDEFQQGFSLHVTSDALGVFTFLLFHPELGSYEQSYNLDYKNVSNSKIFLHPTIQGTKIGRNISMRFIELDVALGIRSILFSAESTVGGYAWARMGYELDTSNSDKILEANILSRTLLLKLNSLKNVIPYQMYSEAQRLSQLKNADDLYHLTRTEGDLRSYLTSCDFEDGGALYTGIVEGAPNEKDGVSLAKKISGVISFCNARGKTLSIGKLQLVGEFWNARADYRNDVQVRRFSEYGGRYRNSVIQVDVPKKTVKPEVELRSFAFR
jgi:hypothetical protein